MHKICRRAVKSFLLVFKGHLRVKNKEAEVVSYSAASDLTAEVLKVVDDLR